MISKWFWRSTTWFICTVAFYSSLTFYFVSHYSNLITSTYCVCKRMSKSAKFVILNSVYSIKSKIVISYHDFQNNYNKVGIPFLACIQAKNIWSKDIFFYFRLFFSGYFNIIGYIIIINLINIIGYIILLYIING